MKQKLSALLARPDIWQASAPPRQVLGLTSGYPALDHSLHRGGWPEDAITELLCDHIGIGELQILLPALAHYARQQRKLVFVAPPFLPYPPALEQAGIAASQVVIVRPGTSAERCWATLQLLQAGTSGAVLSWLGDANHHQLRKLQLAAQSSRGLAVLFRPGLAATEASPAALRIALSPTQHSCRLHILKQRGGWAGQVIDIPRPEYLLQQNMPTAELPVHRPTQHHLGTPLLLTQPTAHTAHSSASSILH